MSYELYIAADADSLAREAAALFVDWARAAVAERGRFRVALSGGSTPGALYRLLAAEPLRSQVPWAQTQVYWGDERHLPVGDPGRNDTEVLPLLGLAGVPAANVHPAPYAPGDADAAAREYEALLRSQARRGEPLLDLVLLGLGNDGHTASLFPGTAALYETERLVAPNYAVYEDRHPERLTLTLPAINAAATALFLVAGENKREVLRRALGLREDPPLPAQCVQPAGGRVVWLVDRAAVGELD